MDRGTSRAGFVSGLGLRLGCWHGEAHGLGDFGSWPAGIWLGPWSLVDFYLGLGDFLVRPKGDLVSDSSLMADRTMDRGISRSIPERTCLARFPITYFHGPGDIMGQLGGDSVSGPVWKKVNFHHVSVPKVKVGITDYKKLNHST